MGMSTIGSEAGAEADRMNMIRQQQKLADESREDSLRSARLKQQQDQADALGALIQAGPARVKKSSDEMKNP
jgi:hypothetical protein